MFENVDFFELFLVTLVLVVIGIPSIVFIRQLVLERRRKQQMERAKQCDRIRKSLSGKKFCVSVRTTKNTKTSMETELIKCMVEFGAKVLEQKPEGDADVLILNATYQMCDHMGISTRVCDHVVDMRVSMGGEIVVADNVWGDDEHALAFNSVLSLSSALK